MKKIFAMTGNVELFVALAHSLETRDRGVDGMGLVFGEPGLGKTETAIWYADKSNAVYYRVKEHTTLRSLLEGIVVELGQAPMYRTSDLYTQAKESLSEHPRTLIVDEVDYIAGHGKGIQTLRDLADETGAPVIMIGMMDAERKVARFRHLYDRLQSHIMRFKPLNEQDVARFAGQICEVGLDDSAITEIYNLSGGKLRKIISELYRIERIAKANSLKSVTGKHLKKAA
ncbi:MAG: AAA family ATPase [Deltaproteobacteria bacterium]|nr:AAA family ATPase [Deltaproteobacteria bacterium]